jgi:uncharacterized membrane protein
MNWFPKLPGWDGIHPAMVHFPIALLFAVPILLLVSLFARKSWRAWSVASLVLMFIGTVAAWLAVASGHAAAQLVDKTPALVRAIGGHESLAVTTRNLFTIMTLVFGGLMVLHTALKKPLPGALRTTIHALFLVAYVGCTIMLANTANRGGRLVHETGVHAIVGPTVATSLPPAEDQASGGRTDSQQK